jgi:phosphate-selective porin OprO/OprP
MYKSLNTDYDDNGVTGGTGGNVTTGWFAGPELRSRQSSNAILSATSLQTGSTTQLAQVRHYNTMGAELAAKWNAFHVAGEYMRLRANYDNADNQSYKGWYVQGGWVWHGADGRGYNFDKGVFEKPVPTDSCYGAWEVALRYSHINLNNPNAPVGGIRNNGTLNTTAAQAATDSNATVTDTGKAKTWTAGVNWYVNTNVAFQFNYSHTRFNFLTAENRKAKGFGLRGQFEF